MNTYRGRREARAERLRGWADKREAKAESAFKQSDALADAIPFGQPILAGHHSQKRAERDRDRIHNAMGRGIEHSDKAASMNQRASGIESQLAGSIYSDDEDAVEQLEKRIAGLEAERDRVKAFNASCRKGAPDLGLLSPAHRADYLSTKAHSPYMLGKGGQMAPYVLTNLGGNITRNRKRLAVLKRKAGQES